MSYVERLAARSAHVGNCLCLGLDPHPMQLPPGFARDVAGVERFAELLLEAALPHAAAVKANVAFYEAFGSAGLGALERIRARVPRDVPFIADAKRADIGSTAERQAAALFEALAADAVTANPYLGFDALRPLLEHDDDRFVYVVCRTSNPSASEVQALDVGGMPLYLRVARLANGWAADRPRLGLVVGATAPAELARTRDVAPGLPFLVPGVGAQGGDVAAVMASGPATAGPASADPAGALLVNVSRAIANAATEDTAADPHEAIATAAAHWSALLRC